MAGRRVSPSNMQCFVVIKCRHHMDGLPQKVVAPIPEQGITEYFKNEIADLPSIGAGAWQQVIGKRAETVNESAFKGLQNILAAESLWVGGNKRIFTLDLEFHAYQDPYAEVYLPVKTLQMMTLPRDAGSPVGEEASFTQEVQGFTKRTLESIGVDAFYYKSPPNISLIIYSILEQNIKNVSERRINDPLSLIREQNFDPIAAEEQIDYNPEPTISSDVLSRKSVLVYAPKAIVSSLSVGWQAPFFKGKGGVYPSAAKVQIQIDTLKVATSTDVAMEKPSGNATAKLRGVSKTYTYR